MKKEFKILFLFFSILFSLFLIFYLLKNVSNRLFLAEVGKFLEKEESVGDKISDLTRKLDSVEEKINEISKKISQLDEKLFNFSDINHLLFSLNSEIEETKKDLEEFKNSSKEKNEEKICQNFNQDPKREVIFNEICWMGTKDSSSNEWIEIKNLMEKEIDLSGWQILNKDQTLKINLTGKILPKDFFLLERSDDDTLPEIKADLIFVGAIRNSDEILYLFDKDCNLQDIVEATSSWPAGDSKTKRTMERKDDFSWQTSEEIGGTPKKENSKGLVEKEEFNEEEKSKISLEYPSEIFSQKEFEVFLSVSGLEKDTYDVKISILKISDETEQKRTISEISLTGEEWQDSYKYLQKVFSGNSFSGKFKLRISQEFFGTAEIVAKIRNQNKKIVGEFSEKINVSYLPKTIATLPTRPPKEEKQEETVPTNLLGNEFFEEWEEGFPKNWQWDGVKSRISQSRDALKGNYSVEITVSTSDYKGFYQFGKEMDSEKEYYAVMWVKGKGVVRLGIKYPNSSYVYYGEETVIDSDEWVEVVVSRKPSGAGIDGGIKLGIKYDETKGIPQNSKLIIGAAWLGISSPPPNWLK